MDQQPAVQPVPVQSPVSPAPAPAALENVPSAWPGAFGLYKYSKQAVKRNLGTLLIFALANLFLSIVLGLLLGQTGRIIGDLTGIVLYVALLFTYLAGVRGQELSVSQAFSRCKPMLLLKYLGQLLFLGITLGLSAILLVVPFFFVFPRVFLAPYFLIDKDLGPLEAIKASWAATKGHAGKVWGTVGAVFLMALLMLTIIGIPFSLYFLFMYGAATALVYEFVNRAQPAPAAAAAPVAPVAPPPAAAPTAQ